MHFVLYGDSKIGTERAAMEGYKRKEKELASSLPSCTSTEPSPLLSFIFALWIAHASATQARLLTLFIFLLLRTRTFP